MKDWIGLCAGFLSTMTFFPQAYKVYLTNSTEDLSINMYMLLLVGLSMWLYYGMIIGSFPLIVTNVIQILLVSYILYKIIKNKN